MGVRFSIHIQMCGGGFLETSDDLETNPVLMEPYFYIHGENMGKT